MELKVLIAHDIKELVELFTKVIEDQVARRHSLSFTVSHHGTELMDIAVSDPPQFCIIYINNIIWVDRSSGLIFPFEQRLKNTTELIEILKKKNRYIFAVLSGSEEKFPEIKKLKLLVDQFVIAPFPMEVLANSIEQFLLVS